MMNKMKKWQMVPVFFIIIFTACQRSTIKTYEAPPEKETVVRQQPAAPAPKPVVPVQPKPEPKRELSFQSVNFDFDKFDLTEKARQILAGHAETLRENPGVALQIEGHCDEFGTIEYNLALGEKRATAVKQYLVNYGIEASRLTTTSYGKERPIDTAQNEQAWAKNRRAVFMITKGGSR